MKSTPFLGGLGNTLRLFFLTAVVLLALLPLWVMLSLAFSDASAVLHHQGPLLWPLKPTLQAFQSLGGEAQLWQALCNSMAVAVVATALHVLSSAMAGYALVHLPLRAKPMITLAVVLTLLLPPQVNSIPLFLLFKSIGLLNTYTALILPATVSGFGVLLFRQWFLSFPPALKESAELEGASPWQTFYYVVLPTAQSPMVSLAVLGFIGLWGSFLWPLLAVQDDHLMTLPVYLAQLKSHYRDVIDWPMLMASATMAIIPVLLFFISLQGTFFAQGSSQDGLK